MRYVPGTYRSSTLVFSQFCSRSMLMTLYDCTLSIPSPENRPSSRPAGASIFCQSAPGQSAVRTGYVPVRSGTFWTTVRRGCPDGVLSCHFHGFQGRVRTYQVRTAEYASVLANFCNVSNIILTSSNRFYHTGFFGRAHVAIYQYITIYS